MKRRAYETYIRSAAWRNSPARLLELERAGKRCRLCARSRPDVRIEVHHRRYENLGSELLADLCTLCSDCHAMVTHELQRRRGGLILPALSDTPRVLPVRDLVISATDGDKWNA